ncbi:MAG: RNA methyltransferase [Bacteroidetes bacterium]|nr:RNA methyltransferase [Bacteroidota bacterium]
MWFFVFDTIFIPYMISKAQVKHIRSLDSKKMRYDCKQFIVEGSKMVQELVKSNFQIVAIYGTKVWREEYLTSNAAAVEYFEITDADLRRISNFTTPNEVLAIVQLPDLPLVHEGGITLALDNIQDPGNLGSIIRIADWYGVSSVVCNTKSVDFFNHKVLQASMGSIFNVPCMTIDLRDYFLSQKERKKYACVLNGDDIHTCPKISEGILVIGNESNGVSAELLELCSHRITIPKKGRAESLNAAVAAGIVCDVLI